MLMQVGLKATMGVRNPMRRTQDADAIPVADGSFIRPELMAEGKHRWRARQNRPGIIRSHYSPPSPCKMMWEADPRRQTCREGTCMPRNIDPLLARSYAAQTSTDTTEIVRVPPHPSGGSGHVGRCDKLAGERLSVAAQVRAISLRRK